MSHSMLEIITSDPSFEIGDIFKGVKPPLGFYRKTKNRIQVIRFLVEDILKRQGPDKLTALSVKTFKTYHLYGLLTTYYNCSPKKALQEAYAEELLHKNIFEDPDIIIPSFFKGTITEFPRNFLTHKTNRQKLTKYFTEFILKKEIYSVSAEDFRSSGLNGFLTHYYGSSPIKALQEAYPNALIFLFSKINKKNLESLEFRKQMVDYYIKKCNLSHPDDIYQVSMNQLVKLGLKLSLARYYHGNLAKMLTECYPHLNKDNFKFKSWKK